MYQQVKVLNMSTYNESHENVDIATTCPHCGVSLIPEIPYASLIEDTVDDSHNKLFVLNYCPHCNECFVSRHIYDNSVDVYMFDSSSQTNFFHVDFSKNIQTFSPSFVSIFTEAAHAESLGLTSICGMGYRKALEFLVKDYSIFTSPGDSDSIAKMPLAQCIDKYITNSKLKTLAKASAWLGNDETHYTKKHSAYGLPELKAFITAFITYVDSELAFSDAAKLISS